MSLFKNIVFTVIAVFFLSSCCIQSKMDEARRVLISAKDTLGVESQRISGIMSTSANKLGDGKIDSTILQLILSRLNTFQNEMVPANKNINTIDGLLGNVKAFRKNYKLIIAPGLDSLRKTILQYRQKVLKYEMLEEGLSIADYRLFDLAAFFGPGKFAVPSDQRETAGITFSPIVDSIIRFSNKYKSLSQTGTLIILGFADGTGFGEGPLADMLAAKIGKKNPSKEELNQKLSELRAEELIGLLSDQFLKNSSKIENKEQLKIRYVKVGKGESLPLPTIKDYKVDDERRRIVLCYWAVLPD